MNLHTHTPMTFRSLFRREQAGERSGDPDGSRYRWLMEDPILRVLSISVFGARGDRYSIVVIPQESIPDERGDRGVEWNLMRNRDDGTVERVLFVLQWTVNMAGSGCVAMCGREMPVFPAASA